LHASRFTAKDVEIFLKITFHHSDILFGLSNKFLEQEFRDYQSEQNFKFNIKLQYT